MNDFMDLESFSLEELNSTISRLEKILQIGKNPVTKPIAFLLGGQPGSGKSGLHIYLKSNFENNIIIVNGDEFRALHPRYNELFLKHGKEVVLHTQKFAGQVTEGIIERLSNHKYHLVIEGTIRSTEVPMNTHKVLEAKGYLTEICVMSVRPEISFLSTKLRYEEMLHTGSIPRITPKEHHDLVVDRLPNNLNILFQTKMFQNVTLYNRNLQCLYSQSNTPEQSPRELLEYIFTRKWTRNELKELNEIVKAIEGYMIKRNAPELQKFQKESSKIQQMAFANAERISIKDKLR